MVEPHKHVNEKAKKYELSRSSLSNVFVYAGSFDGLPKDVGLQSRVRIEYSGSVAYTLHSYM